MLLWMSERALEMDFCLRDNLFSIFFHSYKYIFCSPLNCVCSLCFIYIVLSFSRARGCKYFLLLTSFARKVVFFCLISQLNVTIRNHWASNQFISHTVFNIIITAWCYILLLLLLNKNAARRGFLNVLESFAYDVWQPGTLVFNVVRIVVSEGGFGMQLGILRNIRQIRHTKEY